MESIRNTFENLADELRLVIYATSVYTDEDEQRLINMLSRKPGAIDWKKFIYLTDTRHHVAAPVYKNLNQFSDGFVPADVMNRLRNVAKIRRTTMLAKTGELVRIVKLFKENNIKVLPIKGPALSVQLHDDPCMRFSSDLDVVVQTSQVEAADKVLKQAGYIREIPDFKLTPRQTRAFLDKGHHFVYISSSGRIELELHWKLTTHEKLMPDLKFESVWQQKQHVRIGGVDVPVLSPFHTIVYLSVHGSIHRWYRLIWLHDMIAVLNRYRKEVAWDNVIAYAKNTGIERMVVQGMLLGSSAANTVVPSPAVLRMAEADERIQSLYQMALEALSNENMMAKRSILNFDYYFSKLYGFLLFKSPTYKIKYIKDHMTTISADWTYFSLPDRLFFLYHFMRPVLWFYRRFRPYVNPKSKRIKTTE